MTCIDLPMNISSDFEFGGHVVCPHWERDYHMFEVTNNPVIDCRGHTIHGAKQPKKRTPSKAFNVHGGALFKNCHFDSHEVAIERSNAGEGDSLEIKGSTFSNTASAIIATPSSPDDTLNILVKNSDILYSNKGIDIKTNGYEVKVENTNIISNTVPGVVAGESATDSAGIQISGVVDIVHVTDVFITKYVYGILVDGTVNAKLDLADTRSFGNEYKKK